MNFNPRISLLIDRCTVASERGWRLARVLLHILERLFIPRRMNY
jgi:hypothetical protein